MVQTAYLLYVRFLAGKIAIDEILIVRAKRFSQTRTEKDLVTKCTTCDLKFRYLKKTFISLILF